MQALFVVMALSGGLYFLTKQRQFDYFTVAFFSACIYFMPGFFGVTSYHSGGVWLESPIHAETYMVMITVMGSILGFGWFFSKVVILPRFSFFIHAASSIPYCLAVIGIVGLLAMIISAGVALYVPDKAAVMEHLGRWHILFYVSATLGLPIAFAQKKTALSIFFFFLLLFDLYIGFRSAFAVSLLSVFVLVLSRKGPIRLIPGEMKAATAIVAVGALFFLYKTIGYSVKSGNWSSVVALVTTAETYVLMFKHSEPFVTQAILNQVIISDFRTSATYLLEALGQLSLFLPDMGLTLSSFNDLFQPQLFPDVEYGMASNIWAQMWSAGGWLLLLTFLVPFNCVLALGNSFIRSKSATIRAASAPIFMYWAFYLHRNDLGYILNIEKRMILVLLVCVGIAYFLPTKRRLGVYADNPYHHGP